MKDFTVEEIQILDKYEDRFFSAINAQYIRAIWKSDVDLLKPIYERVTEQKYNMCMNCAASKLKFMKDLGKLYYAHKNKEKNTKENGTINTVSKVQPRAGTKKRPKKKDS